MPPHAPDIAGLTRSVANSMGERVAAGLVAGGHGDVREAGLQALDGVAAGEVTVTQLAVRLRVSAQAVSKTVAELERLGYVRPGHQAGDRRARPLALTPRGEHLVDAARRVRVAVARDLGRWLGTRDSAELVRLLEHAAEHYGAGETPTRP